MIILTEIYDYSNTIIETNVFRHTDIAKCCEKAVNWAVKVELTLTDKVNRCEFSSCDGKGKKYKLKYDDLGILKRRALEDFCKINK